MRFSALMLMCVLVFVTFAPSVAAAEAAAVVAGSVLSTAGAGLPGAVVTITHRGSGRSVIVTAGDRGVYRAGSLPHGWLFDQVSAVVHHGGFGTTAAALRSGAPGIVVPHIIDQFYWGQRVFELGAGPKFIPRGRLKAQALAAAIRQAVGDSGLRERAAELGRQICAEPDGVTMAVHLIESAL